MILTDTGADFEPIPTGVQRAALVNVFDLGLQRGSRGDVNHECVFLWELAGSSKRDGSPFLVARRYTASLNEKANLRKHLRSWRGRDFTDVELRGGFDTSRMLSFNARLNLIMVNRNGKDWVEIDAVMPPDGNPTAYKPRTPRTFVPDWVVKAITNKVPEDAPAPDDGHAESGAAAADQGGYLVP